MNCSRCSRDLSKYNLDRARVLCPSCTQKKVLEIESVSTKQKPTKAKKKLVRELEAVTMQNMTTLPEDWKEIKSEIIKRDKHRCYICNDKAKKPIVHHRDGNQQNNAPGNLTTICLPCHDKLPVAPLREAFYCRVYWHQFPTRAVCIRTGQEGVHPDNCPYYTDEHGCLIASVYSSSKTALREEFFALRGSQEEI